MTIKNEDQTPYLDAYLTPDEVQQFADLLHKVTTGYRKFYGLILVCPSFPSIVGEGDERIIRPTINDISYKTYEEAEALHPAIKIAYLEGMFDEGLASDYPCDDDDDDELETREQ